MRPLRIRFWLLISFYSQFYWLAMSNTCVNPIIYYWMNTRCCFKTKLNFHLLFQSKVSGLLWQGPFWLPATLALGPEETKNLWGAYWHCKDIYKTPQNILTTPSPFYNSHILDLFVSCDVDGLVKVAPNWQHVEWCIFFPSEISSGKSQNQRATLLKNKNSSLKKPLDTQVLLWLWDRYIVTRWYIIDNNDNNDDCNEPLAG